MDITKILPNVCPCYGTDNANPLYEPRKEGGVYAIGTEMFRPFPGYKPGFFDFFPPGKMVFRPVYVGRAGNLLERYRDHSPGGEEDDELREFLQDNRSRAKFRYEYVWYESDRIRLERKLYDHYRPKFNDTRP